MKYELWEWGYRDQSIRARRRLSKGDIMKVVRLAREGNGLSLRNSFRASARGWGRPIKETLLGPLRV